MAKEFTSDEIIAVLREESDGDPDWLTSTFARVNGWLTRGDGIAVYRNEELGHRELGRRQFASYGSPAAAIEVDTAPTQMPDTVDAINWRYRLEGTYRGEQLSLPPLDYSPDDLRNSPRADLRDIVNLRWRAALDNHEPTRDYAYGRAQRYSTNDVTNGVVLWGHAQLKDAIRALYLLDDGDTVRPYHVATWLPEGTARDEETGVMKPGPNINKADPDHYITLHPFPVNVDEDGNPIMRPDGRSVDYGTWMLGPRRAYHLKISEGGS